MSDVAMKTWIRGWRAPCTARAAASTSPSVALANAAMVGARTACAIAAIASISSGEAAAKPASRISTPRASSSCAILSFSDAVMLAPGDCSPSRRVVSKIDMVAMGRRVG
jgi:hypothetical protein